MLPYFICGSLLALGCLVKKAADYFEESDIRRRQQRIRSAKNHYLKVRAENETLARSIGRARKELEYERRGALISYHKHRQIFLEEIGEDLRLAKQAGYDNTRAIHEGLTRLQGWREIGGNAKSAYFSSKDQVHIYIGKLKSLELIAAQEMEKSRIRLRALYDRNTHAKLGGKKAIREYLDSRSATAKSVYAHRSSAGIILPFQNTELVLECRCSNPSCKSYIALEMQFCMVCGKDQGQGIDILPDKKSESGVACGTCGICIDETLPYCFNCGEKNDPFGLIAVYEA